MGLSLTFFNPEKAGFLHKEGGATKSWQKRWVMVTNHCLYYFKDPNDATPAGIVPLEALEVHLLPDMTPRKPVVYFELIGVTGKDGKRALIKGCKAASNGVVVQGARALPAAFFCFF
jgi:cytohesin